MPDQSSAATEHAILQEITRPLQALPDDPLSVVNAEFPVTLRGYDRVAVDDYVRRTRQLVAELQATRSPEAAVRRALERVGEEITGILQRAHETAEQITAQSRSEAEDRMEQARREAAQVAGAAEQRVRDLDADTDRIWLERQRIVGDAEELAAQLLGLAKTAADRFPADGGADGPAAEVDYDEDESPPRETSFAGAEDYYDEAPYRDAEADEAAPGKLAEPGQALHRDAEPDEAAPGEPAEGQAASYEAGEPDDVDDVTQTVAFEPLTRREAPGEAEPVDRADGPAVDPYASSEDPTAERDPAAADARPQTPPETPPRGPATSDDTTAVIPPASQAASRRLSE